LLCAQDNRLTPAEQKAGWILLFDGNSTAAWRGTASDGFPTCWTVDDHCLRTLPSRGTVREDLVSRQTFRDFEWIFEWRLSPGANSGVKYLVQRHVLATGHDYAAGFEMQLVDDGKGPDPARDAIRRTGALYSLIPPSSSQAHPGGEFNQGKVILKGNHVEHWVNGVKVVECELDAKEVVDLIARSKGTTRHMVGWSRRDCPVSLQHHGDPVWFRNIKIRPL
jgi:hypothetical protein